MYTSLLSIWFSVKYYAIVCSVNDTGVVMDLPFQVSLGNSEATRITWYITILPIGGPSRIVVVILNDKNTNPKTTVGT